MYLTIIAVCRQSRLREKERKGNCLSCSLRFTTAGIIGPRVFLIKRSLESRMHNVRASIILSRPAIVMAIIVNNHVLHSAYYSDDVLESRVSSSVVQRLGLKPLDCRVALSVSVPSQSQSSSDPFVCTMSCVVDDSLNSAELVLGVDWLKQASPTLGGLDVVFDNKTICVPLESFVFQKQAHAGDRFFSSSHFTPSSSAAGPSCPVALDSRRGCQALQIISDAFLRDFHHGARTLVFSSSIDSLRNILRLHGIQTDGLSVGGCQDALIIHYISGNCFHNSRRVQLDERKRFEQEASLYLDGNLRDMLTCSNIASGFISAADLTSNVLDVLISSTGISTEHLQRIAHAIGLRILVSAHNPRCSCVTALQTYAANAATPHSFPVLPQSLFLQYEKFKKPDLIDIAAQHGLLVGKKDTVDSLKSAILCHVASAACKHASFAGCQAVRDNYSKDNSCDPDTLLIHLFTTVVKSKSSALLKRVLTLHHIPFSATNGIGQLRQHLKWHIASLRRGKRVNTLSQHHTACEEAEAEHTRRRENIWHNWPQLISPSLKDKILQMFLEQTSSASLTSFTCASCAGNHLKKHQQVLRIQDINLTLLYTPYALPSCVPLPILNSELCSEHPNLLLDPSGVVPEDGTSYSLLLCKECCCSLKAKKRPALSLANLNYLGPVPEELQGLTVVEEAMISRSRAKCWIVQLTENKHGIESPNNQ